MWGALKGWTCDGERPGLRTPWRWRDGLLWVEEERWTLEKEQDGGTNCTNGPNLRNQRWRRTKSAVPVALEKPSFWWRKGNWCRWWRWCGGPGGRRCGSGGGESEALSSHSGSGRDGHEEAGARVHCQTLQYRSHSAMTDHGEELLTVSLCPLLSITPIYFSSQTVSPVITINLLGALAMHFRKQVGRGGKGERKCLGVAKGHALGEKRRIWALKIL